MKVLFLDVDGVLNCANDFETQQRGDCLNRDMIAELNRVVRSTGCKIVLSSTWRLLMPLGEFKFLLRTKCFEFSDEIIDVTPRLERRDEEILTWLRGREDVEVFAVVDDDSFDLTAVKNQLVHTSFQTGMLPKHADKLIEMLS